MAERLCGDVEFTPDGFEVVCDLADGHRGTKHEDLYAGWEWW